MRDPDVSERKGERENALLLVLHGNIFPASND
jgi:hypothetical protein